MIYMLFLPIPLLWWTTAAALFADWQSIGSDAFSDREHRHYIGLAVLLALFPMVWIMTPFLTGFYEHGFNWTFSRRPQG